MNHQIRRAILKQLSDDGVPTDGLAVQFYDPSTWDGDYGTRSSLVVVHDGPRLAPYFNWDYDDLDAVERMRLALEKIGYYPEQCTTWYSAIYPISGGVDVDRSREARSHISMALDHLEDDCRLDAISALEKALAALRS